MAGIFLNVVNMSVSASFIVLAILLLRLFFKKFPKWIFVLLWGVVAIRLVCPVFLESDMSLIPSATVISKAPDSPRPYFDSGVSVLDDPVNEYLHGYYFEGITRPMGYFDNVMEIFSNVWIIGMILLFIYTFYSCYRIKSKIYTAVRFRENVYQSENVDSPFVFGIINPKIYIPFNMSEKELDIVISHEKAHIYRKDHLWKPLGFLLLTVHWFNPLMWIGYVILCRDIELACDEKVIKELDCDLRVDYSEALLSMSVSRRNISACPLAFGEVGVKDRVKTILNYKKPGFWIIVVAILVCLVVSVCFLTNPKIKNRGETDVGKLNHEQIALMEKCPEYFGLDATNGLDVYVWQMAKNNFNFGVLPHTGNSRYWISKDVLNLRGVTCEQMRTILSTYNIDEKDINVIPWQNPLSSYIGEYWIIQEGEDLNAKRDSYILMLREMLFGAMQTGESSPCTVLYVCPIYSFIVDPATVPTVEIENGTAYKRIGADRALLGTVSEIELTYENFDALISMYESVDNSELAADLRENNNVSYDVNIGGADVNGFGVFYVLEQHNGDKVIVYGLYEEGKKTDQIGYIYSISQ